MKVVLFDRKTVEYFGSKHAPLGLVLLWLGLPAFIGGMIFFFSTDEIPSGSSLATAFWGGMALALGISMRRNRPPLWRYRLAVGWMAIPVILSVFSLFLK